MGKQRYQQATLNIAKDRPDFHLTSATRSAPTASTQTEVDERYLAQRDYFGNSPIPHRSSRASNHENEEG